MNQKIFALDLRGHVVGVLVKPAGDLEIKVGSCGCKAQFETECNELPSFRYMSLLYLIRLALSLNACKEYQVTEHQLLKLQLFNYL